MWLSSIALSQELASLRHAAHSELAGWKERCDQGQEEVAHLREKTRLLPEEKEEQNELLRLQPPPPPGPLSAPTSPRALSAEAAPASAVQLPCRRRRS